MTPTSPRRHHQGRRLAAAGLFALLAALPGCGHRPVRHLVVIQGFRFDPPALTVAVGDTVEWVNRDIVPHTSTAAGSEWNSGEIPVRASWRWIASKAGEVRYGCTFHPTMKAALVVR